MKNTILILLAIVTTTSINAQNEFSKWYFGFSPIGLDFLTSPPTTLPFNTLGGYGNGCATMSDNNGNLLFHTDGIHIYNSAHSIMANGSSIGSNLATQSAIIVKQPGNANLYFVFSLQSNNQNFDSRYSIVDMNLAAGLGSVTVKNTPIYTPSAGKQLAVRHCNGKDVWIVSHECGTNNFRAYLLTASGLSSPPVISSIGFTHNCASANAGGELKISPDGKKIGMATSSNSVTTGSAPAGGFHLFDFDAATGTVTNSLTLLTVTDANGIEFSPDGTKLYGSLINNFPTIYQWNICSSNTSAVISSQYSIALTYSVNGSTSGMQRAINNKIYVTTYNQSNLHVINNPNSLGAGMNFSANAQPLANASYHGLPNYINPYTKPTPAQFTSFVACNLAQFAVPPVPTFSSGCSSTPYAPSGYKWDFGDVASGADNTATQANVSHFYTAVGTYTASLILYNNCTNDTLTKVITVTAIGPNPVVTGNTNICKGEQHVYSISGGNSYVWLNTNATTPTQTYAPTASTQYTVKATTNGCTITKSFIVNVSECLGIAEQSSSSAGWLLYPNPTNADLQLNLNTQDAELQVKTRVLNSLGALLQTQTLELKNNTATLKTDELPDGTYTLLINYGNKQTVSKRFVVSR